MIEHPRQLGTPMTLNWSSTYLIPNIVIWYQAKDVQHHKATSTTMALHSKKAERLNKGVPSDCSSEPTKIATVLSFGRSIGIIQWLIWYVSWVNQYKPPGFKHKATLNWRCLQYPAIIYLPLFTKLPLRKDPCGLRSKICPKHQLV